MKNVIYAVVVGRKHVNRRYIAYSPICKDQTATAGDKCLSIFTDYQQARKARKVILADCGHKDVCIVRYGLIV